jgi:hypothetical protein
MNVKQYRLLGKVLAVKLQETEKVVNFEENEM